MVFLSIGMLTSYLRRFQLTAIAINFFIGALAALAYIFVGGAAQQGLLSGSASAVTVDFPLLIESLFCAAA